MYDIGGDNPLKDVDPSKREVEASFRAFGSRTPKFTKAEYELITKAVNMYVKINTTPEERVLYAFDKKAEELVKTLEEATRETSTNVDNGVVTFVSNSKIITDALAKLSLIRKTRSSIMASIKNEAMSEKVRGQIALSPLVRGLIEIPS